MDKLRVRDWVTIAVGVATVIAACIVGEERDHLTKQPDGTYR